MSGIDEYQGRLTLALDRIARGVAVWDPASGADALTDADQKSEVISRLEAEISDLQAEIAQLQAAEAARLEREAAAAEAAEEAAAHDPDDMDLADASDVMSEDAPEDLPEELAPAVPESDGGLEETGAASDEGAWVEVKAEAMTSEDDPLAQGAAPDDEGFDLDGPKDSDVARLTSEVAPEEGAPEDEVADVLDDTSVEALRAEIVRLRAEAVAHEEDDLRLKETLGAAVAEVQDLRRAAARAAEAQDAQTAEVNQEVAAERDAALAEADTLRTALANARAEAEAARAEAAAAAEQAAADQASADPTEDTATLHEQIAAQREGLAAIDTELARLRSLSETLRSNSEALRQANAQGVGDATLINHALEAEYAALKAERAGDQAEIRAVIDALAPLLTQAGVAEPLDDSPAEAPE